MKNFILLAFIIILTAKAQAAEPLYYTVQAAAYKRLPAAERGYNLLSSALNIDDHHELRLEKVGKYFTLRLGRFQQAHNGQVLLAHVRRSFRRAYICKAHILPSRIVKAAPIISPKPKAPMVVIPPSHDKNNQLFAALAYPREPPGFAIKETAVKRIKPGKNYRLMAVVEARILGRLGYYEQALDHFRELRARYPGDVQLWEDYIETLINNHDYELAIQELRHLRRQRPNDLRAGRLLARVWQENGSPRRSYEIFQNILNSGNHDPGILADYANARLAGQDWLGALDYYQQAQEIDPANLAVAQNITTLLQEHRPRLDISWRFLTEDADAETREYNLRFQRQLSAPIQLALDYQRIKETQPAGPAGPAIDVRGRGLNINLKKLNNGRYELAGGLGLYEGIGNGPAWHLNGQAGWLLADGDYNEPWYSELNAAANQGTYNRERLSAQRTFFKSWRGEIELAWQQYYLSDINYGHRHGLSATISHQLMARPGLTMSYNYFASKFVYNGNDRRVAMIPAEESHSLRLYWQHRFCRHWGYSLNVDYGYDMRRALNSWNLTPALWVRFNHHWRADIYYDYLTESDKALGGTSKTININLRTVF